MAKLVFEKVKKDIVSYLIEKSLSYNSLPNVIQVGDVNIVVKTLDRYHELIFRGWFGKRLSSMVTGDVVAAVLDKDVFRNGEDERVYFVFGMYVRYITVKSKHLSEIDGKGFYLKRCAKAEGVYFGAATTILDELFSIEGTKYEHEIAKVVKVAARLSKSLSRCVVPVVDVENNKVVDYAAIGYDDLLFVELLRFLLMREVVMRDVA